LQSKEEQIKVLQEGKGNSSVKKSMFRDNESERYKNLYEEQRQRTNLEHELISNSLYDLTLQFISFKNELVKSSKEDEY
jgi:hypothetical protein